jgi:Protein of unknown function (DUF3800)
MHFFYIDETGCTGSDLANAQQPIFVIGGVSVSDDRWRNTTDAVQVEISKFFKGSIPNGFELHAHQLITGTGPFEGHTQEERNSFAHALLDVVITLKHKVFFVGIDKRRLATAVKGGE